MSDLRTLLVALTLMTAGQEVSAQRIWLNATLEPVDRAQAVYYREPAGPIGELHLGRIHGLDGKLKAEGTYMDAGLRVPHGRFTFYHPDGKVESTGDYKEGNKDGVWQRFDKWGGPLAERLYDAGPLDRIEHTLAKTMPAYPGGEQAMVRAVREQLGRKAPSDASATFVVEKDGSISGLKVLGLDEAGSEAVSSVIGKANWAAGHNDGAPVRVRMSVPLR